MNPQQVQAINDLIDQKVKRAIDDFKNQTLYSTQNSAYFTLNGIDSPSFPIVHYSIVASGIPTMGAKPGTLYINTSATSSTTRFYIMTQGGTQWTYIAANS